MGWRDTKAADCGLSVRTENALLGWRPDVTLGELDAMSDGELLRARGFGYKCLREIRERIAAERSPPADNIRVLRLVEYVGPRAAVGDQVRRAAHDSGMTEGGCRITTLTIGEFPA